MAEYTFTDPVTGRAAIVTAPDGISESQAFEQLQRARKWQARLDAARANVSNPTEGMGAFERFAAGVGKSLVDTGRGAAQLFQTVVGAPPGTELPGTDQASIDEAKLRDAPLMATGAGMAGNLAGLVGQSYVLPIARAATGLGRLALAAGVGGAQGALQPTGSNDSRLLNTALGAGLGAAGQGAANAIGAMASGARAATPALQAARDFADANGGVLTRGQITGSPFGQRLEKMLASLPGSGSFYREAAEANKAAAARALDRITGGAAGDLIQQAGAGKSFIVDQPFIDEMRSIAAKFGGLVDRDAPNSALKTIEQFIGSSKPNPALVGLSDAIKTRAIAQGVPEFVTSTPPKFAIGDTLPLVGPRGDFNNYQALRSLYGQRAFARGGDAADQFAHEAIKDAFDAAAMRSLAAQGADPTAIAAARQAYAVEKIAQPARIVDPVTGDVAYDPALLARRVAATDRAQPGKIDRLGDAGLTLRQLANFAQAAQPLKSSGTAEGHIAGGLATGAILGDVLSGGGLHHLGAALAGLYVTPRVVNAALQGTRNGIPLLRNTPAPVALTLRQLATALPVAATPTLGALIEQAMQP